MYGSRSTIWDSLEARGLDEFGTLPCACFGGFYFWCRMIIFEYLQRGFIFRVSIGIEPECNQGYTIEFGCIGIKFFGRYISYSQFKR